MNEVLKALEDYRLNALAEELAEEEKFLEENCKTSVNANEFIKNNMEKNTHRLFARYGLKHDIEQIDENTWRATDFSRLSFDKVLDDGTYEGVTYIDFDGGPFLHVGMEIPGLKNVVIKEFKARQIDNKISHIDIIVENC